nr:Hint domain-containing protein [Flavimaricola marinus]
MVSPQHRILVGGNRELQDSFESEAFAPAKSLTSLPGI